ncbi:hypothetical protein AWW67_14915 [Roseivirga seohaensis]|uniref:Uncharacterized protein n=1 Tax=Roseivirga seohaensis TaxID=1914963 RepID=A0A150Y377_9BACT|nr:hypothetical protein [Roseivirga seohaensis]KYG85421.1 hypothetical protein AWW67_14915 [Roseivirga seohaensis]
MNDKRIAELLESIADEFNVKLDNYSDSVLLVVTNKSIIQSDKLRLLLEISKGASVSALNTNIKLSLTVSNFESSDFTIKMNNGISRLLSKKRFVVLGDGGNKFAQYWISELKKSSVSGLRSFNASAKNDTFILKVKTPYLNTLEQVLSILLIHFRIE